MRRRGIITVPTPARSIVRRVVGGLPFVVALTSSQAAAEEPAAVAPPPSSFRLLRWGFTGGAALTLTHGATLHTRAARQERASAAPALFVSVLPAYWLSSPTTAQRCAADGFPRGCVAHRVGVLVAKPAAYRASFDVPSDGGARVRDAQPIVTLALTVLPSPYVSTFVGWTFSTLERRDQTAVPAGALSVGLGFHLDVLGALFSRPG